MKRGVFLATLALLVMGASCRCESSGGVDVGKQPTMPTGMLAPAPIVEIDAGAPLSMPQRLRAYGEAPKTGDWVRVRAGSDGAPVRFVSVDTMTILHPAFARAAPGFDLFVPRKIEGDALAHLRTELGMFKQEWVSVGTADIAKAKWGKIAPTLLSITGDEAWIGSRDALSQTIDAITQLSSLATERGLLVEAVH